MLAHITSLFSGILFAVGLSISGMVNPDKVKGFLDIFGNWDYSLIFVMGGAIGINLITNQIIKNKKPWFAKEKFLPTKLEIDWKLIVGSGLFGIGWGLIGICPGPALVNIIKLDSSIFMFIASMLAGMIVFKFTRFGK